MPKHDDETLLMGLAREAWDTHSDPSSEKKRIAMVRQSLGHSPWVWLITRTDKWSFVIDDAIIKLLQEARNRIIAEQSGAPAKASFVGGGGQSRSATTQRSGQATVASSASPGQSSIGAPTVPMASRPIFVASSRASVPTNLRHVGIGSDSQSWSGVPLLQPSAPQSKRSHIKTPTDRRSQAIIQAEAQKRQREVMLRDSPLCNIMIFGKSAYQAIVADVRRYVVQCEKDTFRPMREARFLKTLMGQAEGHMVLGDICGSLEDIKEAYKQADNEAMAVCKSQGMFV